MNHVLIWGAEVFGAVLQVSWQAAILVVVIAVAGRLPFLRLPATWRYRLWLLLVVRLCLMVLPESPVSIFNLLNRPLPSFPPGEPDDSVADSLSSPKRMPRFESLSSLREPVIERTPAVSISPVPTPMGAGGVVPRKRTPFSISNGQASQNWGQIGLAVWCVVMAGLAFRLLVSHVRFSRRLSGHIPVDDEAVLQMLRECRAALGVRQRITLIETSEVETPAMCGLWQKRLLLPDGAFERYSTGELRCILLHELGHVRRYDLELNGLVSLLQIVHWFNPFVWWGFRQLRIERERACDALVLSQLERREFASYGEAIIKSVETALNPSLAPGLLGLTEEKTQIEQRLKLIMAYTRPGQWSALAVLLIAAVSCVGMTGAKSRALVQSTPLEIKRPETKTVGGIAVTESGKLETNLVASIPPTVVARAPGGAGVSPLAPSGSPGTNSPLRLFGTVVDADTGEPIRTFQFIPGTAEVRPDGLANLWKWKNPRAGDDGRFDFTFETVDGQPTTSSPRGFIVRANGYLPTNTPGMNGGDHEFHFKLKKGTGPAGVAVLPDGKVVEGADVFIDGVGYVTMKGRQIDQEFLDMTDFEDAYTKSDPEGRFRLPIIFPDPEVIGVHDLGFGRIKGSELARTGRLVLQPWGQVSGTLKIGDRLGTNVRVRLFPEPFPVSAGLNYYDERFYTTTDEVGQFAFTDVPPGLVIIARGISQPRGHSTSTHARVIDVLPGEVTKVVYGGRGRRIVGKISKQEQNSKWNWASGSHGLNYQGPPKSPQAPAGNRGPGNQVDSGRGLGRYIPEWNPDGTFYIDDVEAGEYMLQLHFIEYAENEGELSGIKFLGSVWKELSVPESDGTKQPPIDLGVLYVNTAGGPLRPPAPDR